MNFNKIITVMLLIFLVTIVGFAQEQSRTDSTKMNHKKIDKEDCCSQKESSQMNKMKHEMKECKVDKAISTDAGLIKNNNLKIWNKVCPVQGEEVDPEAPTVEYKGKTIGFCCPGCDKKFRKDPERYIKNLSEDGTHYIKK